MIMADVAAVFGTLLALGIAFPGLMLTLTLIFPALTGRAETRLTRTPWKSIFLGAAALTFTLIPILALLNLPDSGAQFLGFVGIILLFAVAGIGAAGLANALGSRLDTGETPLSPVAKTVRGAIALELAAAFPLVGWFLVIPATLIASLGAAIFALLRWQPKDRSASTPTPIAPPTEATPV